MAFRVPELIPAVSEAMWVTKKEVSDRATLTMNKVCALIVNRDIEKFIPELIKCIAKPENVPETVHLLGATTFVTEVQEPTLALMVPLLDRGLAERETPSSARPPSLSTTCASSSTTPTSSRPSCPR